MAKTSPQKTLAEWLSAKPDEPTQVTILFTDIVGSTKLNQLIGDKEWLARLNQHRDQGIKLVAEHGGHKIKYIGDAFMVAFRSPVNAFTFAADFHKDTGHNSIHIRACIHTGSVRVTGDDDIFGLMINFASRILKWKKDAGVVLSSEAYNQIMGEYGKQKVQECFIRFKNVNLKDFPRQLLYVLNPDEWWPDRIREAVPDIGELRSAHYVSGCLLRQTTAAEVDWIAELEARTYRADAVPGHILHAWYNVNPTGFLVIHEEDGEKIGHLDILPLKPAGVDLLLQGQKTEQDITPDMIYSPNEQNLMQSFYVESIVIEDKYKALKAKALYGILSNFESLIARICNSQASKTVYGLGGTQGGERLMQQLGFRLIGRADERKDHFPLYVANYDDIKTNVAAIIRRDNAAG